ncbi:MAG: disulfide bond formation protein [Burkholderiales bacterium]|jgi:disulfide bond formation protein DsbB|nr:disulfide bond formation protein [Burkholderiales bacterium]MCE3268230.1 disulfide bond formation protein [Burkholderiales bacterium]
MHRINKPLLLIFLICAATIVYAYYAQYYQGVNPCPLCIVQRLVIAVIGLLCFMLGMTGVSGILNKICSLIIAGITIFGMVIAKRQLYLMNLPLDQQPLSCGMPLDIQFQRLPFNSFLHYVLQGDAECGKVNWLVFGMKPPTAMIVLCCIILLILVYNFFQKYKTLEV